MATGIIDPNAPRKTNVTVSEEKPNDEEEKLCKQIDRLFQTAANHRKKYDKYWVDNYKMFKGDQWLKRRPSYKSKEVVNLIFQAIQGQTSVMLDTRPTVGFLPEEPSDMELAEILNKVFESDWDRNNWSDEVLAQILDGHIYGVGYTYAGYDPDALQGMGSIEYCAKDPFNFYPDPEASNVNKRCKYFIDAEPRDIDAVKLDYAGHKYVSLIKPDLEDISAYKRTEQTLHRRRNTDLDMPQGGGESQNSTDEPKNKVLVTTLYIKPSDTEEIEKDDEKSGEKVYITRLKYPRGRKVVKINDYIFEDGPLPYDHLEFPFHKYVNYCLPREFFGLSEVDNTKGPQMIFNKMINFSLDVLTLMGNPVYMVPVEGKVNTRKLIAQPGLAIEYANGAKPTREEGVQLQPYVLQLIDRMEKWFNDEAGTQDVTRGINPTGVTANAAIENLLEQATKRIKQKMRNLDSCLRDFGKQWVGLCFEYYDVPRIYRTTNKNGLNQFFKFHVEKRPAMDEAGQPVMNPDGSQKLNKFAIIKNYQQTADGQLMADEQAKEYQMRGIFDIKVNTISGLPFAKQKNESDILNLFDRQIIDSEEVLKRLEYPNYQAVQQRMQVAASQQAQQPLPPKEG